jgi:hypothetical protein
MRNLILIVTGLALLGGCGDNSRSCGVGTQVEDGYCVPAGCGAGTVSDEETGECVPDGSVVCSDGTRFNALTGRCEVDPSACQNGTVLVDGKCVDPAAGTLADLNEGPEPNAMNVIEAGDSRAGNIVLGAQPFVVHGTLEPHAGNAPDVDTYVLTIAAPTLLHVSADGLGINAGLIVTSDDVTDWQRFAINLSGDTSERDVFLPQQGTYKLSIAETSTVFEYADSGTAGTTTSSGEYYATFSPRALPTPTALTASANGLLDSGALTFYRATVGAGPHPITVTMPSAFAVASVVVTAASYFAFDDEDAMPARVSPNGVGEALIVVDHVYALSPSGIAYTVSIQ